MERNKSKYVSEDEKNRDLVLFDLFFEKLLENADAAVMVTDEKAVIEFANKRFFERFSFLERAQTGADWIDSLVPQKKRPSVRKIFTALREKEKIAQFDAPVMGPGNLEKKMSWTFVPLDHGQKRLCLFVGSECKSLFGPAVRIHCCSSTRMKKAREEVISLIFKAAKRCDPDTARHSLRVMRFAELLAKKIKLSGERIENLKTASLLHDMGKLVVDSNVLLKKGKLDKKEFEHIKKHLNWGVDLLKLIYFLKDVVSIMCSHHENFDGRGYPEGVRGNKIPIEGRILSIADVYEALTADRSYRKAFSKEEAIAIMEYEKGHKLDPQLTDVFTEMLRKGEIEE
jgi:putative nucleotidyltransferase with HDIG domain